MAFLAFQDFGSAGAGSALRSAMLPCTGPASAEAAQFTSLEWSVVAIARTDRPASLRRPGRIGRVLRWLFGQRNPMLADPRLEALRRIAVLTWHRGYAVAPHEVRAFLSAGFTGRQYERLADRINVLRHRTSRALAA